jgi:hypothetical protein
VRISSESFSPVKESLKAVATQPVQFALEPGSILARAAAGQIFEGLALDREMRFQAEHAVVARRERAADRLQTLEIERRLFSGIDDDDGLAISQLMERSQGR